MTLNIASTIIALRATTITLGTGLKNRVTLNFDSSGVDGNITLDGTGRFIIKSPTTDIIGNLTVSQLVNLNTGALPTCNSVVNGSFARNNTGMLMYCTNGTRWQRVSLSN